MSQDFINNLPTELLFLVFDYLDVEQQLTAKLVCVRWLEIFERERYLVRYRVRLYRNRISSASCQESLKKYRAFNICYIFSDADLQTIRQFLLDDEILEHIEDLNVRFYSYSWMEYFMQNNEVNLPKLEKICFHLTPHQASFDGQVQLMLPNLKTVIVNCFSKVTNYTTCQLLQQCGEQIESLELIVSHRNLADFLSIFESYSFTSMKCLTLRLNGRDNSRVTEFSSTQTESFVTLTELNVFCNREDTIVGYEHIFRAAKNLEKLTINGIIKVNSADVLNGINNLKRLRELSLNISFPDNTFVKTLSLPELQKIAMYSSTLIPEKLSCRLKSLTMSCGCKRFEQEKLAAFFSPFIHQLEDLAIIGSQFDLAMTEQISGLNNLRKLKLRYVLMEPSHLLKILSALKHLNKIEMKKCLLVDEIRDDGGKGNKVNSLSDEDRLRADNILNGLNAEHPRCIILREYCFHTNIVFRSETVAELKRIDAFKSHEYVTEYLNLFDPL